VAPRPAITRPATVLRVAFQPLVIVSNSSQGSGHRDAIRHANST
jgi:hypothetical protein